MNEIVRRGLLRELERLAQVAVRLVRPIALARDERQRPQDERSIGAARPREIQRFAKDAVGVGERARARERFAELAAEDQNRAHRIVELAAEDLAAREIEPAAERDDAPGEVGARSRAIGDL